MFLIELLLQRCPGKHTHPFYSILFIHAMMALADIPKDKTRNNADFDHRR